jgi:hypothetical protein
VCSHGLEMVRAALLGHAWWGGGGGGGPPPPLWVLWGGGGGGQPPPPPPPPSISSRPTEISPQLVCVTQSSAKWLMIVLPAPRQQAGCCQY